MAQADTDMLRDIPHILQDPLNFATASRNKNTIEMVSTAVRHKQTTLAYQPVMRANGGKTPAFYEGLIRVFDETGRIIPAADFMDAVETTDTGRQIDCLALEMGLQTLRDQPNLRLSINMSARSIGYPRWTETLKQGLAHDPTVAERLILEITESSAMMMPELVTTFMASLQEKGIAFALDDFGAGYTAFRYLKEFYFDIIKIDGQFIRGIAQDPDNQVLTRALLSIAEHFDMFSVAESVESAEDAAFLATMGVDCLQGYYYAAPTIHPPWDAKKAPKRA
ncbi:MAG: EAL domain-containing protein [Pseudoruegeria sp.]